MTPDQTPFHNQLTASPEQQAEIAAFWERGRSRPAESFTSQIEALKAGTEMRPTTIYAKSNAIIAGKLTSSTMSEGDAMLELDSFVGQLEQLTPEQAAKLDPQYSQNPHDWAANFRANFSFLGTKEYQKAVNGVAAAWLDYLKRSPDHILNVFDPSTNGDGARHSYGQVVQDITAVLHDDPANVPFLANLRTDPSSWEDAPDAKLIIVDDYSASGNILSKLLRRAAVAAEQQNPAIAQSLLGKAEAHLLIANDSQPEVSASDDQGKKHTAAVRAYYVTPGEDRNWSSFSSYYSSMDYGFSSDLQRYVHELNRQGLDRAEPFLTHIDPPYNGDPLVRDGVGSQLLAELAAENAKLSAITREKEQLQAQARANYLALLASKEEVYGDDHDSYRAEVRRMDDQDQAATEELGHRMRSAVGRQAITRQAVASRKRELEAEPAKY